LDAGNNVHCQATVHSPEGVKPKRCTPSKWRHLEDVLLSTPDSGGHFDVWWHRMAEPLDTLQAMLLQTFWQDTNLPSMSALLAPTAWVLFGHLQGGHYITPNVHTPQPSIQLSPTLTYPTLL